MANAAAASPGTNPERTIDWDEHDRRCVWGLEPAGRNAANGFEHASMAPACDPDGRFQVGLMKLRESSARDGLCVIVVKPGSRLRHDHPEVHGNLGFGEAAELVGELRRCPFGEQLGARSTPHVIGELAVAGHDDRLSFGVDVRVLLQPRDTPTDCGRSRLRSVANRRPRRDGDDVQVGGHPSSISVLSR